MIKYALKIFQPSPNNLCRVSTLQHPPSPLIELNVVESIGGPMLALMAHVHTVLRSPAYPRAANSNDDDNNSSSESTPRVWWQVLPRGHFHNCQGSFHLERESKVTVSATWRLCQSNWFGSRRSAGIANVLRFYLQRAKVGALYILFDQPRKELFNI